MKQNDNDIHAADTRDSSWRAELRAAMPAKERTAIPRAAMPQRDTASPATKK